MKDKKLLIVTNHYLPGYKAGGPIKSVSAISESLKDKFNITVMTSNYDFGDKEPYKNIKYNEELQSNGYNIIYLSEINFLNIFRHIKKINPCVIYLNSFFSKFTILILILKKIGLVNAKIILAPRGELASSALIVKSYKKNTFIKVSRLLNLYNKDILFHSTNDDETVKIQQYFHGNRIKQLMNLSVIHNNINLIKKNKNELKIIFLSRIMPIKNLLFTLKVLKYIDRKNIILDIYGPRENKAYWNKCINIMKTYNNIEANYKGSLTPKEIPFILSKYHLFFLPTKGENFGHAIVEAMQVGLIPLISNQTPWNDLDKYNAGWSLNLKDKDKFVEKIEEVLSYDNNKFLDISKNVKQYIENKLNNIILIDEYKKMFDESIG